MFAWLYRLLGSMLAFFSSITGSYLIALLFYALIFKIVFLPFSIKQQKNQIAMAKLTPKIEAIKAKYKGRTDQPTLQKQQQEIMELQQKEGYNPMSGCLPLLIQLPLIMLLYAVIQNPLSYIAKTNQTLDNYNEIRSSESFVIDDLDDDFYSHYESIINDKKEITQTDAILALYNQYVASEPADELPQNVEIDLISKITTYVNNGLEGEETTKEERIARVESFGISYESIPNFMLFGSNLAETPSFTNFSILVFIPIIAALFSWLSMFISRKLNATGMPAGGDAQTQASMKIMDLMMPLMTLFFAFNFSGMLGMYWILQSVLGLIQTFILAKVMPMPKFTEEEIAAMKRQQKEAERAARAAAKAQPKHKSLHYIDEDDYDELPEIGGSGSGDAKRGGGIGGDMPEIKD